MTRPARGERAAWVLLGLLAAALVALSVASAANYTSVVVAHATVAVLPSYEVSLQGLEADGRLAPDGSVSVRVSVRVVNPSDRVLRWTLLAYSGWIEDWPAEDGVNGSRLPTDDRLVNASGLHLFHRAFGESQEVSAPPIPPRADATFRFAFTLDRASDPARFEGVRNITGYGVARAGSAGAPPWNHWLRVQLAIDGVPEASSPTAGAYLRAASRVEREWGINLA